MIAHREIPLELLESGEWAEVTDVAGDPRWINRIAEMGLRPGVQVLMLQPGCPCLFQLGAGRLSLRGEGAVMVLVRPLLAPVEVG